MNLRRSLKHVFLMLLLAACSPAADPAPAGTSAGDAQPPARTVAELIEILYASDPALPQYDPGSSGYAGFAGALEQLAGMGPEAVDAASHLAAAITFPRPDSYLAAQALLALGPEITTTTLPWLLDNLGSQDSEARVYSLVLLGSAGGDASCSLGEVAPLLWDADPVVRTAASLALEKITGQDLVSAEQEPVITPSFLAASIAGDEPEGSISGEARKWWSEEGQKTDWRPGYGLCDP